MTREVSEELSLMRLFSRKLYGSSARWSVPSPGFTHAHSVAGLELERVGPQHVVLVSQALASVVVPPRLD